MKRIFFFALLALAIFSCKKKQNDLSLSKDASELQEKNHTWYYFSNDNFLQTNSPSEVPFQNTKPWTEATRIASFSSELGDGTNAPNSYAIVNRLGVIVFSENQIKLYKDPKIFSDRTVTHIFFQNDVPFFSLYKSSFFNTSLANVTNKNDLHLFLIQFDKKENVCYPVITCKNLTVNSLSEITDFIWDGSSFLCSIKTDDAEKTAFSYLSIQPKISLQNITPVNAEQNILTSSADETSFREQITPKDFSLAPERLKNTLSLLDYKIPFYVTCSTSGGASPRHYKNANDDEHALKAVAKIADTYVCALFQDGTAYFTGALYERHVFQDKKIQTFLLPTLPAGFVYSDFAITKTMLYAAWEELSFYKTGRSGFIAVDLDSILYGTPQ
ncbi:MAG: hypothetical protein IKI31_03475 [Treponema sp.]|nr:hypothetical protein [Treponema sp.]